MEDEPMKGTENELKSILSLKKKKCPTVINSAKRFNEGNPGKKSGRCGKVLLGSSQTAT